MMDVSKNGRRVLAMVMNEPVNDVYGVVQCAIDGCHAYMPIMAGPGEDMPSDQIADFLDHHDCNPKRFQETA